MKSKSFNIPSVGQVIVAKHARSRRITLRIKPGEDPKVIIPNLMTYQMGLSFAIEKKDWIIKHKEKLEKRLPNKIIYNELNSFKTRFTTIQFKIQGNKLSINKKDNCITLNFPDGTNIESDRNQNIIKNFIIEILRGEAIKHLIPKVEELASRYDFQYKNVFVKNLKSRWGSCSAINNINLNLHLMCLPEHLSDFVVLHELCHTVHKNHGSEFHELLNTLCGNEKLLNTELRKYSISTLV